MKDLLQPTRCARLLKALADPDRLRIVAALRKGPQTVSDLADCLRAPLANISHHLGVLRHAGIVLDQKQGRFVSYQLNPDVFQPTGVVAEVEYLDLGCCRLEIPRP